MLEIYLAIIFEVLWYTHYEIKGSKALFQYSRYKGILALFAQN